MKDNTYLDEIERIRKKLSEKLPSARYEHSLSVSFTSVCLAMRYGCDLKQAELAGLLHDCAKQFGSKELIDKCRECGIELSKDELAAPQVIHARYGAYLARKRFDITDEEVLSAIRWHTVGKPNMSLLEAIVFTADYIEARRDKAPNLTQVRRLAFEDLNRCVYEIMKATVDYLEEKGTAVSEESLAAYRFYSRYAQ